MTEVMPRLFIGDWRDAERSIGQLHIVTCAHDSPITGNAKFGLVDGPGNPPELLIAAAEYAAEAYIKGKQGVLIHCHGGRSRSGVVMVATMIKITGKPLCECYDLLMNRHEITRIHPYLSLLLLAHEESLR